MRYGYTHIYCCISLLVDKKDELSVLEGEGVVIIFNAVSLHGTNLLGNNLQKQEPQLSINKTTLSIIGKMAIRKEVV